MKFKTKERILKQLFIFNAMTTLANLTVLLYLSYTLSPIEDKINPMENAVITISLLIFGGFSIYSRYKTRILMFNVLAICYSMTLVLREGADDIQHIANPDSTQDHMAVRALRVLLACQLGLASVFSYIIRDTILTADIKHLEKMNVSHIEKVKEIGRTIVSQDTIVGARILHSPICKDCKDKSNEYVLQRLAYDLKGTEVNCIICDKELSQDSKITVVNEWFETPKDSITDDIFESYM
ncbi:unnamed protein product [Blepharisma stoltei]|uniref:Uncharacterized protein n=1 Tax=Blepharisma stoltei TaxID=1481888 RepID=A0AAU9JV18_9CILI|nr:unnamed protein product [Blepharisma stoltei]